MARGIVGMLTMGSLFDGSGGFPLAGKMAGIKTLWRSEIEPFPILVTKTRMPEVKHYGDVSSLSGKDLSPVDVITFGSPCQDLSLAGKHAGLHDGQRSNLFFQAIRIIKEMREATNGQYPRFAVWENVYGAFISNDGEDFRSVLEALCQVKTETFTVPRPKDGEWATSGCILGDGLSVAWRGLDAQYWGVPQRRKRIYLVADFTATSAPEILFNEDRMHRDFTQGKSTEQGNTGFSGKSTDGTDKAIIIENHPADARLKADTVCPTLSERMGTGGNNTPLVAYNLCSTLGRGYKSDNPFVFVTKTDISKTLDCNCARPDKNQGGTLIAYNVHSTHGNGYKSDNPFGAFAKADTAKCLDCRAGSPNKNQGGTLIVYSAGFTSGFVNSKLNLASSLVATSYKQPPILYQEKDTDETIAVRRLTPLECCRLQGFPDWWCDNLANPDPSQEDLAFWDEVFKTHSQIMGKSSKGKSEKQIRKWLANPYTDEAQYKMWGNGVALPCVYFVMSGIAEAAELKRLPAEYKEKRRRAKSK